MSKYHCVLKSRISYTATIFVCFITKMNILSPDLQYGGGGADEIQNLQKLHTGLTETGFVMWLSMAWFL